MARKRKAHKGVAGHIASFKKVKKHSKRGGRKSHKRSKKG
jgi:hypothetical protein